MKLKIVDLSKRRQRSGAESLCRVAQPSAVTTERVREILQAVQEEGDAALLRFTKQFDGLSLTRKSLRIRKRAEVPEEPIRQALSHSLENIRKFSFHGIPKNRQLRNKEGARISETYLPLQRVGLYIPGGTAPLVSTALMTVGLAQVAGVAEIVVTTPPRVNPVLHYALELAGATEIYQVGGAQAIAALAYGTNTIAPVQKIFGPGNAYVVEAKRQVFGTVNVDLLPGPSEIAVVADRSGRADFIAADLLAQAEHGSGSEIIFLTDSRRLLGEVQRQIEEQVVRLRRQKQLVEVLENRAVLVLTRTIPEAISLVEDYAPEHLALITADARKLAETIRHSGAIFIGSFSPVAAGDYLAGPSHTLPTGGSGKSFAGLTIDQFFKRTSVVEYDEKSIGRAAPLIAILAELEQLDAHAASARIRLSPPKDSSAGR